MTAIPKIPLHAHNERRNITKAANRVTIGSLFGLVAGLVTQVIVASYFGASQENDAFLTALTIPLYLQSVLLSGLSFVFIPTFVKDVTAGREEDAWALVGAYFWIIGLVLLPIAVTIAWLAPTAVLWLAPGYTSGKLEMTARMLAILIFTVPLSGYSIFTGAIENARERFFWPAARSAVGALANVMTVILLYRSIGGMALAWGYGVGILMEASITTFPVLRHGWQRVEPFGSKRVRDTAKLVAPLILFGIFSRITPVFERYFASGLPDGALSYLGYAAKLASMFERVMGVTVVTALFPIMSRAYAEQGGPGLLRQLGYGMRLTLAIALPIIAVAAALAVPLTTLLFERGAFDRDTTRYVAQIVPIALLDFMTYGMIGRLLARTFYVTGDTHTSPIAAVIAAFTYLPLAYMGVHLWGYVGLALAESTSGVLYICLLTLLLALKFRVFPGKQFVRALSVYGAPAVLAYLVGWLLVVQLPPLPMFLPLLLAGGGAMTAYLLSLAWLDREIAVALLEVSGVARGGWWVMQSKWWMAKG